MVDIPGNNTTTRTISVGGTTSDTLEVAGDHDWFRIQLTAGQSISVFLDGITLEDPYLRIRDASGNVLYENDDITTGTNRDSQLAFTATYTGTFYIDVGGWEENYAGTYSLSVSPYTPPPVATIQEVANQLVSGYWGGDTHHFGVSPGGQISVNLSALTPAGQNLARAALATWTDIIGVSFPEVLTGGQIVFDDNQEGAFSQSNWGGNGIISSSIVNVSTEWLSTYGTTLNGYSFQTYIHEIGHALGLGHAGNYNETARYPFDAEFQNDSWSVSIMSYFSQSENTYFAGQGFDENFITTPMMADILAVSMLYGLSTTTRVGDTSYGPSWTQNMGALCIFDSGGNDTIDLSGRSGSQRIDLNPGSFSNVLGEVGNVSIALGVTIENAIGGSGGDKLIGNAAANLLRGNGGSDTLTGGAGNDIFLDTAAGLNGDTISDFSAGDRIVISNASLASFNFSLSGSTLTYSGGSLTLSGFTGQLKASAAAGGGVQLSPQPAAAYAGRFDFNGDGRSDILWRHDNGLLTDWLGSPNGGFSANFANSANNVSTDWQVVGIGDFNGDTRSDVLWRHSNGQITDWLGKANGGFTENFANSANSVSTDWNISGVGDFNGDGRSDILWRHDNGQITDWLGTANGGFAQNFANSANSVSTAWNVAGIGDFNGDGRSDILWRHDGGLLIDWLGTANGGFTENFANSATNVSSDWNVAGIGDFNGDGRDDILWRNDNGVLTNWLGDADGGFTVNNDDVFTQVALDWFVAGTGDYNGDGRDDILWRNDSGQVTDWLGNANGGFTDNTANALSSAATAWHVQSPDILWA